MGANRAASATVLTGAVAAAAAVGLLMAGGAAASHPSGVRSVVGLTDSGRLVSFPADAPQATRSLGRVTGLTGDTGLVGIDYRVQDGRLYGVGEAGGVYTVDTSRRPARAVKVSQLTVPLRGTSFGVDFNPAANRLRVVSDAGQNLRHNIDDPVGAPAAGTTATDGSLSSTTPATGVTAAAYTNNDLDPATATTLFDIDTALDQVSVQSPANAGSLAPTGKLGVDAGAWAGFDIGAANRALATLDPGTGQRLYTVDLLTGRATSVGAFPRRAQVVDLAIPLPRPRPTSSPSASPLPSSTPSASPLPSSTPSASPLPSSTPSASPLPSSTPSASPLPSSTPSASPLPSSTPSASPLPSSTPSASPLPSSAQSAGTAR
jgi:hypothetical protein